MAAQSSLRHDEGNGSVSTAERSRASGRGRLEVYAALGAWAGAVPLPWVPDLLVRSVRGALVHDIGVRHGLSLTPEAREVLASPSAPGVQRTLVRQAVRFLSVKLAVQTLTRFGPVGLVWPARTALGTFALGYLFDRYLERGRAATLHGTPHATVRRAVRIDEEEARRVRHAVDGAILRAFGVRPAQGHEPSALDDQRDPATAFVDGLLALAARLPGRVLDHLDAAFDELVTRDGASPDSPGRGRNPDDG